VGDDTEDIPIWDWCCLAQFMQTVNVVVDVSLLSVSSFISASDIVIGILDNTLSNTMAMKAFSSGGSPMNPVDRHPAWYDATCQLRFRLGAWSKATE
jgi:hypothetical protein